MKKPVNIDKDSKSPKPKANYKVNTTKKSNKTKTSGTKSIATKSKVKAADPNAPIRLNKLLADSGVASRRACDELIESGAVKVNGKIVSELGTKVLRTDFITVKGDPIREKSNFIYILLNKPKNVITTSSDDRGRATVLDIVKKQTRIFPIGRLDRNTTGALLLTNDGDLAFRLTHPSYEIPRIYSVRIDKSLSIDHARQIADGVNLGDEQTAPAELFILPDDNTKIILTLKEGKNREVKRIFEHFGYEVKQLHRKFFANISVQDLQYGEYRHLTKKEVMELKKLVKLI